MSLATQAAADVASVIASGDVGESCLVAGATVTGLWSEVALEDLGAGFVADAAQLHVPAASLVAGLPARGEAVLRLSDASDWQIDAVRGGPVWCVLTLLKSLRPVPRGG